MQWGERGKQKGGGGTQNRAFGFEQGSSRMGIRHHGQKADIPSEGTFLH